jgi:hypothetical protein
MRTVHLARVAAQAEIILIRRTVAVAVRRAIYGAVAAVFALAVLTLVHVLAVMALERYAQLTPIISCTIVLAVDLVIAVIFGLLAAGEISDPVAEDARQLRDQSLEQARQSLTLAALIAPLTRLIAQTGLIRILIRAANGTLRRSRA